MTYKPPFSITPAILNLVRDIAHILGIVSANKKSFAPIKLRKSNNIKTIQASLAIEGNTLSTSQITSIIDKKHVVGPKKDILEVKNAIKIYEDLSIWNPALHPVDWTELSSK